jgi:hypothetical protein
VAQTLKLRAYGRTVELVGPKEVVDLAVQLLPSSYRLTSGPAERRWTVQSGHGGQWSTLVDGTALAMHLDPDSATETALSDLELWVAEHADPWVQLVWKDEPHGCAGTGRSHLLLR